MAVAITLTLTFISSLVLHNAIRRFPLVLYILAIFLDVVYFASFGFASTSRLHTVLFFLMQQCGLAFCLFVVVMFAGAFSSQSRIGQALRSIRGELSIAAWILTAGHMGIYLARYVPRLLMGASVKGRVAVSLVVALVLFALLFVLGATSLKAVKRLFDAALWKRIQLLAYPFFALIFVHLALMLIPAARAGNATACARLFVYGIVLVAYIAARGTRAIQDARTFRKNEIRAVSRTSKKRVQSTG